MMKDYALRFLRLATMSFAIGLWVWMSGWLLFLIGVTFTYPKEPIEPTDAIIVLTGGQNRVNSGLDLLADNKAEYLFISGVNPDVKIEELVKIWRTDLDFIPCCIVLGQAASNTEGNAEESSEWVRAQNLKSIRLLTSNYHLPRAWLEFRHALPKQKIIVHPIHPTSMDSDSRDFLGLSFAEYNKTILTWIRLYIYPWDELMGKGGK